MFSYKEGNAHPYLNTKNIVCGSREFRVPSHVATQIQNVNLVKVLFKVLSHSVKRNLFDETVVGHEGYYALTPYAICCPPNSLHVRIAQLVNKRGFRIFRIGI